MASVPRMVIHPTTLLAAVLLALASLVAPAPAMEASQNPHPGQPGRDAHKLEGTWRVQITIVSCQTGVPVAAPFPAMATFGREGTMITSDGGLSPTARGAGHGVWRFLSPGAFEAQTEAFLFTNGVRTGTQRLRQDLQLGVDGDEFTARVSSEILNADGNLVFSGCATSVGRRME